MSADSADNSYRPKVLVSYAPQAGPVDNASAECLSLLERYLRPIANRGVLEFQIEEMLPPNASWEAELDRQLQNCDIFIALLSGSIGAQHSVSRLLSIVFDHQAHSENFRFYPLVLTRLSGIQRSEPWWDMTPFSSYSEMEQHSRMAELADEIAKVSRGITTSKSTGAASPSRQGSKLSTDAAGIGPHAAIRLNSEKIPGPLSFDQMAAAIQTCKLAPASGLRDSYGSDAGWREEMSSRMSEVFRDRGYEDDGRRAYESELWEDESRERELELRERESDLRERESARATPSSRPLALKQLAAFVALGLSAAIATFLFRHQIEALLGWVFPDPTPSPPFPPTPLHPSVPSIDSTFVPAQTDAIAKDSVDVIVFAPKKSHRGGKFLVQVFISAQDQGKYAINTKALKADPTTVERKIATLLVELSHGDGIDVRLEGDHVDIENDFRHLTWNGQSISCDFVIRIPEMPYAFQHTLMRATVYREKIPVGDVTFVVEIGRAISAEDEVEPTGYSSRVFTRAFFSYSSEDVSTIKGVVQAYEIANIKCFWDRKSLKPGENWAKRIEYEIHKSDLFLLCWSEAARNSKMVEREIEIAIYCNRRWPESPLSRPAIKPLILEGPPPPKPPHYLKHLNFDDPIMYIVPKSKSDAARP